MRTTSASRSTRRGSSSTSSPQLSPDTEPCLSLAPARRSGTSAARFPRATSRCSSRRGLATGRRTGSRRSFTLRPSPCARARRSRGPSTASPTRRTRGKDSKAGPLSVRRGRARKPCCRCRSSLGGCRCVAATLAVTWLGHRAPTTPLLQGSGHHHRVQHRRQAQPSGPRAELQDAMTPPV